MIGDRALERRDAIPLLSIIVMTVADDGLPIEVELSVPCLFPATAGEVDP